ERHAPAGAGRSQPGALRRCPAGSRPGADHHRNSPGGGILLCRGLSSAVPAQESGWLLRPRGDWNLHEVIVFYLQIQRITNKTSALRNSLFDVSDSTTM